MAQRPAELITARSGGTTATMRPVNAAAYEKAKAQADQIAAAALARPSTREPRSTLAAGFDGIYQGGLSAAEENGCCSPADTSGAIGRNLYIQMANRMIALYDRNLNRLSQISLASWLGAPSTVDYCEPQIQWDPLANRWFYSFEFCNAAAGSEDFHFGWSTTADPYNLAGDWCHFAVGTGQYLMDAPKLGHDNNFLVIGASAFDDSQNFAFVSAAIWVIPKPAPDSTSCPDANTLNLYVFGDPASPLLNQDGTRAFAPVPANTVDSSDNDMILAAHSDTGAQHALMRWHLVRNGDGSPNLVSDGDLAVQLFSVPSSVPQPGTTGYTLDTLDARLGNAVARFDPGTGVEAVWTQHTIADPAGSGRSVMRWYEIGAPGALTNPLQEGNIGDPTDWIFNGGISPTAGGDAAVIVYNRGGPSDKTDIEAQSRHQSTAAGAMDPGAMAVGGSQNIDVDWSCTPGPCRWGEYPTLTPDISGGSDNRYVVWGASEVIGGNGCQCSTSNWETRIFAATAAFPPDAPSGLRADPGNGLIRLRWRAPSSNFAPITRYVITPYIGGVAQVAREEAGSPPPSFAVINGLNNGTAYTFTVTADNEAGRGPASQPSAAVMPGTSQTVAPPPSSHALSNRPGKPPAAPKHPAISSPARAVPPAPVPLQADSAVSFQISPALDNDQGVDSLTPPLRQDWLSAGISGGDSYGLIAGGHVFVLGSNAFAGGQVTALDSSTGALAWGPVSIGGLFGAPATGGIAYDEGRLLALNNKGALSAFDARTGTVLWGPLQLSPGDTWYVPPVAMGGVVYSVGEITAGFPGDAVSAVRESDGSLMWTQTLFGSGAGTPALSTGGVYLANSYGVYDLSPTSGVPLWRFDTVTTGSRPGVSLHAGRLYVHDTAGNLVFDARTGRQLGTFPAGIGPAFSGSRGFVLLPASGPTPATLEAFDLSTGSTLWTFTGDNALESAPIVVNGIVYIHSQSGLFGVDAMSGAQTWSGTLNSSIGIFAPNGYLTAGQGILAAPGGPGIIAYAS